MGYHDKIVYIDDFKNAQFCAGDKNIKGVYLKEDIGKANESRKIEVPLMTPETFKQKYVL